MATKQINSVVTALRPLQADISELVSEINNLWMQLQAIYRTKLPEREQLSVIVRLNLTDSIEKFQILLSTLSSHVSTLQSNMPLSKSMKLSSNFETDLDCLLEHLKAILSEYDEQLTKISDCLEPEEVETALGERNLYEENYQLSIAIRRIKADLLLSN